VTISSIAAPDLRAICRTALARDVVSSEPIGAGRNSRVFRVDLTDAEPPAPLAVVVKFYRRDAGDARDRLSTEFRSLQFLWQNDVRAVPRPIAIDHDRQCAIYEYIAGEPAASREIAPEDIDTSVRFLSALKRLRGAPGSEALPAASEACFSLDEVVTSVERRLERLQRAEPGADDVARMHGWIAETFAPFLSEVREWCREAARRSGIAFDEPIRQEARTLSPSDFGFHNAIRRPDGTLAFVDFEYFGWDDPAKTIVDYLLHPGMGLGEPIKRRFAVGARAAFADVPMLAERARLVYPLFGLKWAMILLNDFLPARFSPPQSEWRRTQLRKAQALVGRLAAEYRDNPYLD
jgi:phosphotransferase family enzyme